MVKLNKKFLVFIMLVISLQAKIGNSSDNSSKWQEEDFIYTTSKGNTVVNHRKLIGMDKIPSSLSGEGCKIAIIDVGWFNCKSDVEHALTKETKVRLGNLPLEEKEKNSYQFGHANLVASIISGKNGIAPKAQLEVFVSSNEDDKKDEEAISETVELINQAIESKVDIINMSIGWGKIGSYFPKEIEQALYKARDARIGVVLAASNDSNIAKSIILGEGMYIGIDNVLLNMRGYMRIATASVYFLYDNKLEESIANFSNHLSESCANYALTAPGSQILSYYPYGEEEVWEGTSASTPVVTAAAALLKGAYKNLNSNEIFDLLEKGARKIKFNSISRHEHKINELNKNLNRSFISYCNKHSIGRGGRMRHSSQINPHFEKYVDESHAREYGLFKYHFGQGVIDISNSFKLKSNMND